MEFEFKRNKNLENKLFCAYNYCNYDTSGNIIVYISSNNDFININEYIINFPKKIKKIL